jgi:hypothetical protein
MSLLKQLLEEFDGGTGAGDIAGGGGAYGSLFGGGVLPQGKKKKTNVIRRVTLLRPEFQSKLPKSKGWHSIESKYPTLKETLSIASEESDFDASEVLSKIDDAKRKVDNNNNCAIFGLEDSDGNVVKVYVNRDQAKEFEEELSTMLYNDKHVNIEDEDSNSSVEIAELLWKVKDKFEIVDIEWGALPEDEEEQQTVAGEEGDAELGGEEGEPVDGEELPAGEEELGAEDEMMPDADVGGEDESVKSALQQVIDMLRADAEAKMAEAKARSDEAKAKQAEFAARAAESKIRQEEQTLEMEDYYNAKKEEDNEVKKLVKLAKYKHDKAKDYGSMIQNNSVPEEDEEEVDEPNENEVSTDELVNLLISRLQHN